MSKRYVTGTLVCLVLLLAFSAVSAEVQIEIAVPGQRGRLTEKEEARRNQIMQIAGKGSYADFQAAIKILESAADDDGALSSKDLETWLALHLNRPERSSLEKALRVLDHTGKSRELTFNELYLLGLLYAKTGDPEDWREAKETFKKLLEDSPGDLRVSEAYARQLLQHDEIEAAQPIAKFASPTTRIRTRARYEAKRGETNKAIDVLVASLPTALDTPQQHAQLLSMTAIAEELGKYDSAFYRFSQEQLARLVNWVPSEALRLVSSRGIHGDAATAKSALQGCQKATEGIATKARARVAVAILRERQSEWDGPLKEELRQVGEWLGELVTETPDDWSLRWSLAAYYDMVGDLAQAKREYLSILNSIGVERPIERGMLLNNLAYAMAHSEDQDGARVMIREAREILGPIGDVIDTEGFLHYARGENELAIKSFRAAITEGSTVQKQFHLVLALDKAEDPMALKTWRAALAAGLNKHVVPVPLQHEFLRLAGKYRR